MTELAEVIIDLAPHLASALAADGMLIVSGIIAPRAEAVADRLRQSGLVIAERKEDGEWVALVARR